MCAKKEDSKPRPQERLLSCNRRDHRRGLTLACSRLKMAYFLSPRRKCHIVPNTGDFFQNQNRLLPLKGVVWKARCRVVEAKWQPGILCPHFASPSALERKPPALGLCPGAVLSVSL